MESNIIILNQVSSFMRASFTPPKRCYNSLWKTFQYSKYGTDYLFNGTLLPHLLNVTRIRDNFHTNFLVNQLPNFSVDTYKVQSAIKLEFSQIFRKIACIKTKQGTDKDSERNWHTRTCGILSYMHASTGVMSKLYYTLLSLWFTT